MKASKAKRLEDLFKFEEIAGKRVYVVDDHHKALAPWALERRQLNLPPILITLDHHTDTYEAFLGAAAVRAPYDNEKRESIRADLLAQLGWQDDVRLLAAVAKLRHDEQIDAAAQCGAIGAAFCIQLSDSGGSPQSIEERAFREHRQALWPKLPVLPIPTRPLTYVPPSNRVFTVPYDCYIGCKQQPHNDECFVRQASQVIESAYLEDQLARAAEMSQSIGLECPEVAPYILDIDLDVFHTRQAIEPADPGTFYRLVQGAVAVTIATEAQCVDELWEDEQNKLSSDELLTRTLEHIKRALA